MLGDIEIKIKFVKLYLEVFWLLGANINVIFYFIGHDIIIFDIPIRY